MKAPMSVGCYYGDRPQGIQTIVEPQIDAVPACLVFKPFEKKYIVSKVIEYFTECFLKYLFQVACGVVLAAIIVKIVFFFWPNLFQ